MALQSAAMAEAFGKNYQYGKRKISSMSNDEFNKLTPQQINSEIFANIKSAIPSMQQSMMDLRTLQSEIIQELVQYVKQLPSDLFAGLAGGGATGGQSGTSPIDSLAGVLQLMNWNPLQQAHADTGQDMFSIDNQSPPGGSHGINMGQESELAKEIARKESDRRFELEQERIRRERAIKEKEQQDKMAQQAQERVKADAGKIKASLTQMSIRNNLILEINNIGKTIKQLTAQLANSRSANVNNVSASINNEKKRLTHYQNELTNLLNRYKF